MQDIVDKNRCKTLLIKTEYSEIIRESWTNGLQTTLMVGQNIQISLNGYVRLISMVGYILVVGNIFTTAGQKRVVISVAGCTHSCSKGTHNIRPHSFFFWGHKNCSRATCGSSFFFFFLGPLEFAYEQHAGRRLPTPVLYDVVTAS